MVKLPAYIYVETQGGYRMQIKCDKKVNFTPNQFYESKELYLDGAEKILSVQAFARTTSIESLNGEVRVGYLLTIRALYLNQDGMVEKREESYDLTSSLRANVNANSFALVNTTVIGVEYHGSQNLKVRVMVEQKGCYIQNCNFEPIENPSLCYKKKSTNIKSICPLRNTEFVVDKNEKCNFNVGQMLCADTILSVKNVSIATDICEIEGVATIYFSHINEGELKGQSLSFPFSYELLSEGIKAGDVASITLLPISTTLNVTELDSGVELDVQILVEAKGYFEQKSEVEYAIDAYSKEYELALTNGEVVMEDDGCNFASKERFSATLPLDEITDAVEIISIGVPWVGASNVSAKPTITIDGVICSEIILKRESGEYARVLAEIPYSFDLKEDSTCSSDIDARLDIIELSARIRFGATLEIAGEVSVTVSGSSEKVVYYLEKAENIGERIKNDAVISVYLVGEGETLFDCAKALQSDEEELLALNPELDLPLKEGDKVLLYRPL